MMSVNVGPRVSLSEGGLGAFEQQYDLGEIHAARDLGGTYNGNARLDTARGTFVVRINRPWLTPVALEGVRRVKAQLRHLGIPTVLPTPIRTVGAYVRGKP